MSVNIVDAAETSLVSVDFDSVGSLNGHQIRNLITKIEIAAMKSDNKIDSPAKHLFSKGVYARELFIPKGSLIVGKIHKHENLNIMSSGDLSILSVEGVIRVKAPYSTVSSPGIKRVAYAHEDTVWTTIHGTDETDLEIIEDQFIAKTYDDVPALNVADVELLEGECPGQP